MKRDGYVAPTFIYPCALLYPVGTKSGDNPKDFPSKRASCTKKLAVSLSPSPAIEADIWISICTNPASIKSEQELKTSGSWPLGQVSTRSIKFK